LETQDLTGQKFGRWTVVSFDSRSGRAKYWNCVCECGNAGAVFGSDLKRGGSLSCGCLKKEMSAQRLTSHGKSRTPIYRSWIQMRQRCENPHHTGFSLYGGRRIRISDEWMSFDVFDRDMAPTWRKGLSLDRINTDGNYCKENCRWATPKEQANNRRTNRFIDTPEGPMTVAMACDKYGPSNITIRSRIRYGWPENQLLNPVREHK